MPPSSNKQKVGIWNTIPDLETLNMLAKCVDFVYLDLEHGFRDVQTVTSAVLLLNALGKDYSVRVRSYDDPIIQTIIDFNVRDIIVPQLRTMDEFQAFKQRLNLPTLGVRGVHPRSDFTSRVTGPADVSITIIIETRESLALLDYFVKDSQVNTIYLGVFDLAQELEISDGPHSKQLDIYFNRISEICKLNGVSFAAMLPLGLSLGDFKEKGVDKVLLGIDLILLNEAVRYRADSELH